MHRRTLKIAAVVAFLVSPSALAAIPAQFTGDGATDRTVTSAEAAPQLLLTHYRGDRIGRGRHHEFRGGRHDHGRGHFRHGRDRHHPHYRPHHRPRHFHGHGHRHFRGRPIRRVFCHWWRHHN